MSTIINHFDPLEINISFTDTAIDKFQELQSGYPSKVFSLSLNKKGCSGYAYDLQQIEKEDLDENLIKVKNTDFDFYINSKYLDILNNITIDWVKTSLKSEFIFKNPNAENTCGCGESFSL